MFATIQRSSSVLLMLAVVVLSGCESSVAPTEQVVMPKEQLDKLRAQFAAVEEPNDTVGVIALRDSFPSEDEEPAIDAEPDPADETAPVEPVDYDNVVVVGKVGGKQPAEMEAADFPIVQKEAVFFIVDPAFEEDDLGHEHGEDHDCPFCNKKATEAQAIVQFLGDDDKPLPVCAKALFDLEEGALVVVSGKAELQLDTLVITARDIFIR